MNLLLGGWDLLLSLNWNAIVRLCYVILSSLISSSHLDRLVRNQIRGVTLAIHHHLILIWSKVSLRACLGRWYLIELGFLTTRCRDFALHLRHLTPSDCFWFLLCCYLSSHDYCRRRNSLLRKIPPSLDTRLVSCCLMMDHVSWLDYWSRGSRFNQLLSRLGSCLLLCHGLTSCLWSSPIAMCIISSMDITISGSTIGPYIKILWLLSIILLFPLRLEEIIVTWQMSHVRRCLPRFSWLLLIDLGCLVFVRNILLMLIWWVRLERLELGWIMISIRIGTVLCCVDHSHWVTWLLWLCMARVDSPIIKSVCSGVGALRLCISWLSIPIFSVSTSRLAGLIWPSKHNLMSA